MSWNNQGGGQRRSPGRGPWGQGPFGPQPPSDLEEIIRRVQEALGKLTPGGSGAGGKGLGGRGALFVLLAALLVWFAWGTFYTVQPSEVGINLVFGRYTGKTAAGLNTNWPWPIGSVIKVPVWDQQITEVGYRSLGGSGDIPEESQMLTGDKNIVDVHFRVNWQIDPAKPEDYVFNILGPRETVKAVAESIMREVVGLKTIDGILTTDRASVEADVQKRMQDLLNTYRAGVLVKQVQLQSVDAPSEVLSAYRDVTAAQQDQQRAVNEAETYANKVVPEAEGGAARIVAEAKAYREQTILEAKGQTSRYTQIYDQYKKAPGVTRERMYLETMEHVLGPMDKTIVEFELRQPARAIYCARAVAAQDGRERQMRSLNGVVLAAIAVFAIILVSMATFIVNPTEQALILRFGQPVRDLIDAPGLYFKWPFVDTVVYIDKRILALDNERQEVLVSDNQRLEVDAFVRYHIADPLLFYQSVFDTRGADAQLGGMLNSALRRSLSGASITDIVRDKRDALMADIRDQMIAGAKRFGLDVIDVRIKRADLPAENSEAVFRRMQTERQQRAASYRAQGSQQSQQIKAEADRKVTVITATAQQQSDQVRGEGDGERNRIFAEAYGADPEFFAFYRSMQAYQNSFDNGRTRALISPKSDFFRYFSTPTPAAETAPAPSGNPAPSAKAD